MNIFIMTVGSRGDVQPMVALGKGLKEVGHNVTVATSASFEPFITENGLSYGYMTDELMQLVDSDAARSAMGDSKNPIAYMQAMAQMTKDGNRINRQLMLDAWEAAKIAQPDLIIYHPKAFAGAHIAEKLGIPAMIAVLQPMIVSTSEYPPIGFPPKQWGGWYNRLGYKMISMGYGAYNGMVNTFRQESLGLGKLPRGVNILGNKATPVLHGFSKYVLPRPSDWPDTAHITGYWFLDQQTDWTPPADLQAFLDAGEPPVYVGFGSMAGRDPQRLTTAVIGGLQKANVRGVVASGWGGIKATDLPETIFKIEQAPHDWLFQRVAAVVHHGGAGTTAAGLRAGKPTVICSFFGDQPFWGEQVHKLGVGPKHIAQKKVTTDTLAAAITETVSNASMRQKAETLGAQIRQEDGIGNAIAIIEKVMQR